MIEAGGRASGPPNIYKLKSPGTALAAGAFCCGGHGLFSVFARQGAQIEAQYDTGQGDSGRQVFDNGQHVILP
jgi:hypothetical protein